MTDDRITVRSVTGVDLSLSIAGPGTRSYAFVIDWHIRALLASAWLLVVYYVFNIALTVKSRGALIAFLPAAIIYFLYHPILEIAMQGQTPGKRMAGVRIAQRDGGPPSVAALLIRNIFRMVDSLPATYLIGLASCFLTAHRVRIGDMAAGTLLVLDGGAAEKSLLRIESLAAHSPLRLDALELVDQVLERWNSLEYASRSKIARSLLQQLDAAADPAALQNLNDFDLRAKLQSYLGPQSGAAHV
ncbi:MAG TPA: RDD family protein [Steroidobacteraceae bacterium]|nr:RDD family protein [Steroidobacteraceae bacterium]